MYSVDSADVLLIGSFERVIFYTISILYHLNCEKVLTGLILSALLSVTIFIFYDANILQYGAFYKPIGCHIFTLKLTQAQVFIYLSM